MVIILLYHTSSWGYDARVLVMSVAISTVGKRFTDIIIEVSTPFSDDGLARCDAINLNTTNAQ